MISKYTIVTYHCNLITFLKDNQVLSFKKEKRNIMISIIITYYTGLNILKSNLSILLQQNLNNTEIIIVNDNPNNRLTKEMLPINQNISIRILSMPQNRGYAAACNYGAQSANGELLIFMDSDILVAAGWLKHLLNAYNSTENCGAVSTTILNLNQKKVVHWGLAMNKGMEVIKPFRDGFLPKQIQHGNYEFNMASSGCILIPKEVFNKVGGFEEQFYNGFCDLDLTYKITRQKFKCVYCSDAIVYHRGKVSGITRTAAEDDTRALFIRKWSKNPLDDGLNLLKKLYSMNISQHISPEYLIINFSLSLFARDYHTILLDCLGARLKSYYEFRNQASSSIILEDFLPWSLCGLNVPIIYFVDNISIIMNNQHWFMHRVGKKDLIADKNGNLVMIENLLI